MSDEGHKNWSESYVVTPHLDGLVQMALVYLDAGVPLHLKGPAGVGKTSLALYLAARRGRPVHVIYGNEGYRGFDLLGGVIGKRKRVVIDNYVHRVLKQTEDSNENWADSELLRAVCEGGTLVYDEFTRSRPEANNVLLSILEEGVVHVPAIRRGPRLVPVHRDFRIILTSNPTEYAGVKRNTDALRDRLATIRMGGRDFETDCEIVASRSRLSRDDAATVLRAVRHRLRPDKHEAIKSLRPALMIARVLRHAGLKADPHDTIFKRICDDLVGVAAEERHGVE